MLTRLRVTNFKRLDEFDIELGDVVVFIGPNNSGKTSALQSLLLWSAGVREWASQRKTGIPGKRPGITMSRLGLSQIPLRDAKHLWRDLHVLDLERSNGEQRTKPVFLEISVNGEEGSHSWECGLEFYYANPESLYCRPLRVGSKDQTGRMPVPEQARDVNVALLPPLSGLSPEEAELQPGRIAVLIGEGRSGEVLRNLCLRVFERDRQRWEAVRSGISRMFRATLGDPIRDVARGVIELGYKEDRVELDITSAGRGLQQVLLLLAHMNSNPGAVLLLDEPDAHLEVIRQREVYSALTELARESGNQLIIASHSEVVMQDATDRDVVVSFVGRPRRVDDRGSQVLKALRDIRAEDYYQADRKGFVLYLEGSTDLAILRGFARVLDHPAMVLLTDPFVVYVGNVPQKVSNHFWGLRAAKGDLKAFALFDRLDRGLPDGFGVRVHVWSRREIENYFATPAVLMRFAGMANPHDLVERAEAARRQEAMAAALNDIESALRTLRRDPWSADSKVSDEVLKPLFETYYGRLGTTNRMSKSDYHILLDAVGPEDIDPEVVAVLDHLAAAAE